MALLDQQSYQQRQGQEQNLRQRQTQSLILNQGLRQSLEMLSLSNQELREHIQRELEENPLLEEVEEAGEAEEAGEQAIEQAEAPLAIEEAYLEAAGETGSLGYDEGAEGREGDPIQDRATASETLKEHLLWQLRLSQLDEQQLAWGEVIISAIDDRGYLTSSLEELFSADQNGKNQDSIDSIERIDSIESMEAIREVLALIQGLDPVGCGAEDAAASLRIQAKALRPEDQVTQTILAKSLADLGKLNFEKIGQEHGFTQEEIENSIKFIHTLKPRPGAHFSVQRPQYIAPDIIVSSRGNRLEVAIGSDHIPVLRINQRYDDILGDPSRKSTSQTSLQTTSRGDEEWRYLQSKRQAASWLIRSIEQRRQTLSKVVMAIVRLQAGFFQKGPLHLAPLALRQIAEEVDLHESTVSRSIRNKTVETRWGRFGLKYFFSAALKSSQAKGEPSEALSGSSARSIQNSIAKLVKNEEAEKPLSDQEIAAILEKQGTRIARRTVAKYRKKLLIPAADQRKRAKKLLKIHESGCS